MKYPKLIVVSGSALLFAVSAPIAWGQARPVPGSAIEAGGAATQESASAMGQDVSRKIKQAWSEGKDASGAAAFHENGEIALINGNEQEAKGFFRSALNALNTLNAVPESEASNRSLH
jgi:hypothetical protein